MVAMFFTQGLFVPMGVLATYILGHLLIAGDVPRGGLWFAAAYLVGAAFAFWVFTAVYKRLARMVTTSRFGAGGQMTCDADGVLLRTEHSVWRTGWKDVEELVIGKQSLGVVISGIVLIVPLTAFEDKSAMQAAHDRMSDWLGAAGGPS